MYVWEIMLLLGCGIASCKRGRNPLEHAHCQLVLALRGGDGGRVIKASESARVNPAVLPTQVEAEAWDEQDEIKWRHEPASTDDWSTTEWAEATWRHFKTPEQLDQFVLDFSSDEPEDLTNPRETQAAGHALPTTRGLVPLSSAQKETTVDFDSDLSDCIAFPCEGAPLAGVDIDKLHKEVVKYDISSDSDRYDDETSRDEEEGKEHLHADGNGLTASEQMDQLIDATMEAEDQIEQWHLHNPKFLGVICRADEWNATKYLNITAEQDAANRALWDACTENDVRACRQALARGALVDAANWVSLHLPRGALRIVLILHASAGGPLLAWTPLRCALRRNSLPGCTRRGIWGGCGCTRC